METDILKMPVAGRDVELLDMYNKRSGNLIKKSALRQNNLKLPFYAQLSLEKPTVEYWVSDNLEDLFSNLCVDQKLQQIFLSSCSINKHIKLNTLRGGIIYTKYVNSIHVNLDNMDSLPADIFQNLQGTHAITDVFYGWQIFIHVEYKNGEYSPSSRDQREQLEKRLREQLKNLEAQILLEKRSSTETESEFAVKIYSEAFTALDRNQNQPIRTVDELIQKLCIELPNMVSKPVNFTATPLTALRKLHPNENRSPRLGVGNDAFPEIRPVSIDCPSASDPDQPLYENIDRFAYVSGSEEYESLHWKEPQNTADTNCQTFDIRNTKIFSYVKDELNILIMGETGAGKSTWINGFANYLHFKTLKEAQSGETLCLVPIAFTLTDDDFNQRDVKLGSDDENEEIEKDQSCTQFLKTYRFTCKESKAIIRLIDTPGLGDTRGIGNDREHFQDILSHIKRIDKLHGIIVLLKPNQARLTILFEYCIKELLANLHKDASRNIVFCFSNARSTCYRPGDTMPALQKLLETNNIGIKPCKETVYCIDNESVRFLAAVKCGIEFTEKEQNDFSESWTRSVDQIDRLVRHLATLEPHLVMNTLSINDVRLLILSFGQPLADITANIQKNLSLLKEFEYKISSSAANISELGNDLFYIRRITMQIVPLNQSINVCTARKCTSELRDGKQIKTHYHCSQESRNWPIKFINKNKAKCKDCGCERGMHITITYETVVQEIRNPASKSLQSIAETVKELHDEQSLITTANVKFTCFLKHNAIAPYNDAVGRYLEYMIHKETDLEILKSLHKIQNDYYKEVEQFESTVKAPNSNIKQPTSEDVNKLIEQLYAMKHFGNHIKTAVHAVNTLEKRAVTACEVLVSPVKLPTSPQPILRRPLPTDKAASSPKSVVFRR